MRTKKFFCGSTCVYLKCVRNVMDEKYLYHVLQNLHLERLNVGKTVPSLPRERLENIEIDVPSMAYQFYVIDILERMKADIDRDCKAQRDIVLEEYRSLRDEVFGMLSPK